MRRKTKIYEDSICPACGEECEVVAMDAGFDYSGTHVTNGLPGTYYHSDHGSPISKCCEVYIEEATETEPDYSVFEEVAKSLKW